MTTDEFLKKIHAPTTWGGIFLWYLKAVIVGAIGGLMWALVEFYAKMKP